MVVRGVRSPRGKPSAERDGDARWLDHLAGCVTCREQTSADALLRGALATPPTELGAGFDRQLRQRLERRAAGGSPTARRPGRLRPAGLWTLGAYGTVAAFASVVVLSRLPWQSINMSPALAITLGLLILLSPLVLLDRTGIVRPPG